GAAGRSAAPRAPQPGREFIRTERLLLRFAVYGAEAGAAVASAKFLDRNGQVRVVLPVTPAAGEDATHEVDLPLSFAAPGDYLVAIAATSGSDTVETLVPIRVLSRP
ncbi:MAG: hypothetical protein ACRD1S_15770, partial [Vicinamibacterales bacterium]